MKRLALLLIPISCIALFLGLVQFSSPNVADPDAFYHLRQAQLFRQEKFNAVTKFPWLPYSVVSSSGADPWWGFHMLLSGFSYRNGGSQKIKFLTVILGTLLCSTFFLLLRNMKVRWDLFWTVILLIASSDFLFRIIMLRPHVVSVTLLLITIWLLIKRYYLPLFIVVLIWSTIEVSALIMIPVIALWTLLDHYVTPSRRLRPAIITMVGLAIGILVHPSFPNNLNLIKSLVSVLGYSIRGVDLTQGNELGHYQLDTFLNVNLVILPIWGIAIATWFKHSATRYSAASKFLFSISVGACIAAIFVRRFVEYWIPLAVFFSAYIFQPYIAELSIKNIMNWFRRSWHFRLSLSIVIITFILASYYTVAQTMSYLRASTPSHAFQGATQWLVEHSATEEIVFNTRWDQFAPLFYWDQKNYYVAGMDPTFMYLYNQTLYQEWYDISTDKPTDSGALREVLVNNFHAKYLFLENMKNPKLKNLADTNSNIFKIEYSDSNTTLYKIE